MIERTLTSPAPIEQQPELTPRELLAIRFQVSSGTLTGAAALLAIAGLCGWIFAVPALRTVFPGFPAMKVNEALALLLTSAALWMHRGTALSGWRLTFLRVSAGLALAIALLTAIEYLTGINLGIDQLLLSDAEAGLAPGRMAMTTAVCIALINGAMLVADRTGRYWVAQALAGGALLITTLTFVFYFIGPDQVSGSAPPLGRMAVHTALAMIVLVAGFFFARPQEGVMEPVIDPGVGGFLIRQLLPVIFFLPLLLAWLSWQGVRAGAYQSSYAIALFVTLIISVLGYTVWAGGGLLRSFEQKRLLAEAERQQSEERMRRAITGAPVPMVIHNGDRILHMSRGWADVSGFTLEDTPTLSDWIAAAMPGKGDVATSRDRITAAVAALEQPIRTRDGDDRLWEFSTTALGTQGSDRVFLTLAADVTARRQAEAELRGVNESLEQRIADRTAELTRANDALKRQSDQLREQATLLDLVRDGILVRDLYGTIIYWSAGAAEMYGWDRAAALGQVSHKLLKTEYPKPIAEIEKHVTADGFWEGEVVQTTKSGTRVFVESRWTLTRTERGAPEGFLEVNRDITLRRRAQDSLRDSELRFRAVAETAIEGIVSLDQAGLIRYWNPGAERLFGRPASEVLGQPIAVAMPEPFLSTFKGDAGDTAMGGTFETIGRRRDGREFPLETSVAAWSNTQGERFFTAIVRDITARKAAERALEAKAEELSRSNQELEQFAYVASHDLQEPLRMVSNYTQLLARRYKDKLDADANEFIDFAVDGAKRMQDLIHDLLQYARVGTRGKQFRPVRVDQIVADVLTNLSSSIAETHAKVEVDPLPILTCDGVQLMQVFQNLIGNAVKFRRPGTAPLVRVTATPGEGAWTLTVRDNGIGIEPKYFDRIFQMFQRLHGRGEYPGTGIGLAICKKIVERHGGRIRVESQPGQGAAFSFTIPEPGLQARTPDESH